MKRLNVAVIGCGSWGRNHARIYNDLTNATLVAVQDVSLKNAKEVGDKYGADWCTELDKIIDRPDVEAISICSPTTTHASLGMAAVTSGKHVLVEKPMANTLDEAKALIKAADSSGVYLAVGFVERFNPAVCKAITKISRGDIGEVILAHARRVSRRPPRIGDVGVVKDLAVHDIDIFNQFFNSSAKEVFATAGNIAHKFEDYANIVIRFEGNKSAFLETNWLTPRKVRRLIVTGTKGLIDVEYIRQEMTVENNQGLHQPFIENKEPLQLELEGFVDSILHDRQPKPTGLDGLKALEICEAALLSAKTGRVVRISWD